jgi:D-galactarolactone cycloisomerase
VAVNLHLLASLPDLPGGAHPVQPLLEYDTTPNRFREELLVEPLNVLGRVAEEGGSIGLPKGPGFGFEIDFDFVDEFLVDN